MLPTFFNSALTLPLLELGLRSTNILFHSKISVLSDPCISFVIVSTNRRWFLISKTVLLTKSLCFMHRNEINCNCNAFGLSRHFLHQLQLGQKLCGIVCLHSGQGGRGEDRSEKLGRVSHLRGWTSKAP